MAGTLDRLLSTPAAGPTSPPPIEPGSTLDRLLGGGAPAPDQTAIYNPEKSAGMGASAVASLSVDPQARINYFAKQRGIPASRYQVINGGIAYKADDGKFYLEEPQGRFWPHSLQEAGQMFARQVGPLIPATTGTIAGVGTAPLLLTGPAGYAASLAATAGSAATGEAAREGLGKYLMGGEMSPTEIAKQGVLGAAGQGIGAGMTAWAQRGIAQDIAQLNRPGATTLRQKANAQGIPLTPAEETNLASLKAEQKMLGNMPASSDRLNTFYQERSKTIADQVRAFLNKVSPQDSPELAGGQIRQAAQDTMATVRKDAQAAAGPHYDAAYKVGDMFSAQLSTLVKRPSMQGALGRAYRIAAEEGRNPTDIGLVMNKAGEVELGKVPTTQTWDYVKRGLDDVLEQFRNPHTGKLVLDESGRAINATKVALLKELDTLNPSFGLARKTYAGEIGPLADLQKGLVGTLGKLDDTKLQSAAAKLFDPKASGPNAMLSARMALEKQNPEAWQAVKRAWLQQQWEAAGQEFATAAGPVVNQGAKFRALLMGNDPQRRMMKTALSPQEFSALGDLADVLEATGRVKPIGSDTAWNQEMVRAARYAATPTIAKVARVMRPQDWGKLVEDWATERSLKGNAAKYADIITQPGASAALRQLKQMQPGSAQWRSGVGAFLMQFGNYALGGGDATPPQGQ